MVGIEEMSAYALAKGLVSDGHSVEEACEIANLPMDRFDVIDNAHNIADDIYKQCFSGFAEADDELDSE